MLRDELAAQGAHHPDTYRDKPQSPKKGNVIMAKLQVVPKVAAGSVTMDQIPAEFVAEFEAAWADLQKNPNTELRVEFDDKAERLSWLNMARSYGEQRMEENGDSAKLKVRATPKRNLPDTVAYISITRDIPGDGAANTHK